jgi:hypothetical protein
MPDPDNDDIDYLHPHGKPASPKVDKQKHAFDGRELEEDAKSKKNALIDADGHHICSPECQKRHKLQT